MTVTVDAIWAVAVAFLLIAVGMFIGSLIATVIIRKRG